MFALQILQHTPTWVFGLLFALIALGVSQAFPRAMGLRRSVVMPLAMGCLSLSGVVTAFGGQPWALLAWAAALAVAVAALHGRIDMTAVSFDATTRRFRLPGSWLPLALMMSLFALKFVVGAGLALHPDLRQSTTFALAACGAGGLFSGIFLARALPLWMLARQSLAQRAAIGG